MSKYLRFGKSKSHKNKRADETAHSTTDEATKNPGLYPSLGGSIYEPETASLDSYQSSNFSNPDTDSDPDWVNLNETRNPDFDLTQHTNSKLLENQQVNMTKHHNNARDYFQPQQYQPLDSKTTPGQNTATPEKLEDELKMTGAMVKELCVNLLHPNVVKTVIIYLCFYYFPDLVIKGFVWLGVLCLLHEPLRRPVREALLTGFVGFVAVLNGFALTLIQSIRLSMQTLRQRTEQNQGNQ